MRRKIPRVNRRLTPLLLLSLTLSLIFASFGCQKDVQEVRRQDNYRRAEEARRRDVPVAPRGEPVGISAPPATPG